MEVTDINLFTSRMVSNRTEVNHRCGVTRRKPLSARSVSQSDVHLWSFLVDFAMDLPWFTMDLPWIYLLFPWKPWKPWIYHGFTMDLPWIYLLFPWKPWIYHGFTMDLPIISMESRSLLEAFDHFQVDYTELRGPWQVRHLRGEDLAMFTAFSRHYSSLVWEQPCIMLFAQLHISYIIYICIYIYLHIHIHIHIYIYIHIHIHI